MLIISFGAFIFLHESLCQRRSFTYRILNILYLIKKEKSYKHDASSIAYQCRQYQEPQTTIPKRHCLYSVCLTIQACKCSYRTNIVQKIRKIVLFFSDILLKATMLKNYIIKSLKLFWPKYRFPYAKMYNQLTVLYV